LVGLLQPLAALLVHPLAVLCSVVEGQAHRRRRGQSLAAVSIVVGEAGLSFLQDAVMLIVLFAPFLVPSSMAVHC
jgi:hypothetical protein